MTIRSICFCFVLLTLGVIVTTDPNETLKEAPLLRCAQVSKKERSHFHLVRRCARSDARVVITANFSSLWRCSEFALFKRGLAVNFGWITGGLGHCEVLECPEHDTLASLRRRENYDYYSLYANPLPSIDWLCVPKLGIFRIGRGEAKSGSKRKCKEWAYTPTPRNKTEGEKDNSSSSSGDQIGLSTSVATARPDDHSIQELKPSSPTTPSPASPDETPFPSFPFPPSFESPFEPPFLPPDAFQGGQEGPSLLWDPEYRKSESLNSSIRIDAKPRLAGRLANVLSQDRTTNITKFLSSRIGRLFPPVLIGLATVPGDANLFATSDGEPLPCFRFRAWAPGHPLPWKRLNVILQQRSSTSKPATHTKTNVTVKANATTVHSNSTQATKNETANNETKIEIMPVPLSVAERNGDEMTLCVYLHRDGLWHTSLCSTRTLFLCELLPSGGPCRDANSTEERAECEYEKIGTKDDRCSAWNGEMITTTMMPTEPEKGDGNNGGDDSENANGPDDDNKDEENGNEYGEYEYSDEPTEDNETNNGDQDKDDYDYDNSDEDNKDNIQNNESPDTAIRDDNSDGAG